MNPHIDYAICRILESIGRVLGHMTPVQSLKNWYKEQPELFLKRVYNQSGLDRPVYPEGGGLEHEFQNENAVGLRCLTNGDLASPA